MLHAAKIAGETSVGSLDRLFGSGQCGEESAELWSEVLWISSVSVWGLGVDFDRLVWRIASLSTKNLRAEKVVTTGIRGICGVMH